MAPNQPHAGQSETASGEICPDVDAARKQVERILASETLRTSDVIRKLLRFLADKTFAGEAGELKEYSVGLDGVGKPASYDPRRDAGVRLQASRLRQKLDDYYRDEGANDAVIIELPKGRFKISWRLRYPETPPTPPVAIPGAPPIDLANTQSQTSILKKWQRLAAVFAVMSVILAGVSIWTLISVDHTRNGTARVSASSPELDSLWRPFVSSSHRIIIAFSDPVFARLHVKDGPDLVIHQSHVSRWENMVKSPQYGVISRVLGAPPAEPSLDFAMRCDLISSFVLGQFLATRRGDVSVTRIGELSWQQFADNDVILLAPRARIDEKQAALPVKTAFIFNDDGITNVNPAVGEPSRYPTVSYPEDGAGDALELISVMPGPLGRTKVLSFANNLAWAGPGAVESLTDPSFARVLAEKLKGNGKDFPDYYQVLIRISYRGGTAISSSYVTHRVLTASHGSGESAKSSLNQR